MSYNFKVGDKVKRKAFGYDKVECGEGYTVKDVDLTKINPLQLEEVEGWYCPSGFESVREEPKQCPRELLKVWEELQKPFEDRKDIEYWEARGAKWILKESSRRMISAELIYRIKPEPQMTWEVFKQELFKLSAIRNVRVVCTKHQVIVTVEYKGIREETRVYNCYNESFFKQSTIDLIKSKTGVI